MRYALLVAGALTVLAPTLSAQDTPTRWQRRSGPTEIPVTVFHSPQSANLPTAEMLRKGEWLFEISHRFFPTLSQGADALWGFDGPVINRFGLAYAPADRIMVGLLRSNLSDNLELNAKVKLAAGGRDAVPVMAAVMGGIAWNTQLPTGAAYDSNESQAYVQLILNTLLGGRLAVGVVPTLLHNPRVDAVEKGSAFVLGLNAQLYVSPQMSFFGEWVAAESRTDLEYDAGSIGIELETGGHFFKVLLSNTVRLNPTQNLGGTPFKFTGDELRVGFNITRLLAF